MAGLVVAAGVLGEVEHRQPHAVAGDGRGPRGHVMMGEQERPAGDRVGAAEEHLAGRLDGDRVEDSEGG
jgi:hypothetical protein